MTTMMLEHAPTNGNHQDWVMINFEVLTINERPQTCSQHQLSKPDQAANSASIAPVPSIAPVLSPHGFLPQIVQVLLSGSPEEQVEATIRLRKMLSVETNPPIQEIIDAGAIPHLIQSLHRHDFPLLQFEAAWALTNVASGSTETTAWLVGNGVVPLFVQLLSSPNADVQEQAVWALGNIAGDCPATRDVVLFHGALAGLLSICASCSKLSMLRNASWSLSNLLRGKPQPPLEIVVTALPTLASLVNSDDLEVLSDALWALSYATDGTNDRIAAVLSHSSLLSRVVQCLGSPMNRVATPALRTVGNMASGHDAQAQALIDAGALPVIAALLAHRKAIVQKEACWTLSNITAGNCAQVQAVMDCKTIFPQLLQLALRNPHADVRREALWAVSNALSCGSAQQIAGLFEQQCSQLCGAFCNALDSDEPRMLLVALEGIDNMLAAGDHQASHAALPTNPFHAPLDQLAACTKIARLAQVAGQGEGEGEGEGEGGRVQVQVTTARILRDRLAA